MRKFIKINIRKITLLLIITLLFSVFALIYVKINDNNDTTINKFNNNIINFTYDNNWKIKSKSDNNVVLVHDDLAKIEIIVTKLSVEKKYEKLDSLIKEIKYSIETTNENYTLIAEEKIKFGNANLESYKFLYENNSNQSLVIATKIEDNIIIYLFQSNTDYYDILLDSAKNLFNSFELSNKNIDLESSLNMIEVNDITWLGTDVVTSTKEYTLAENNYIVEYEIPIQFDLLSFNNTFGQFNIKNKNVTLTSNIYNYNIYEWINSDDYGKLKSEINYAKEYGTNVVVDVMANSSFENAYIYRITYDKYFADDTHSYENIYMIYPLDNKKTFLIKLTAENEKISKEYIENINIVNKENIANYIYRETENNFVINKMKSSFMNDKTYYDITLKTPFDWYEKDINRNLFEYRTFSKDCLDKYKFCNNTLTYMIAEVYKKTDEEIANIIRNDYTDATVSRVENISYNKKEYSSFKLEYEKDINLETTEKYKFYELILYEKLDSNYVFIIKLSSTNTEFDINNIDDILNYNIKIEKYNK